MIVLVASVIGISARPSTWTDALSSSRSSSPSRTSSIARAPGHVLHKRRWPMESSTTATPMPRWSSKSRWAPRREGSASSSSPPRACSASSSPPLRRRFVIAQFCHRPRWLIPPLGGLFMVSCEVYPLLPRRRDSVIGRLHSSPCSAPPHATDPRLGTALQFQCHGAARATGSWARWRRNADRRSAIRVIKCFPPWASASRRRSSAAAVTAWRGITSQAPPSSLHGVRDQRARRSPVGRLGEPLSAQHIPQLEEASRISVQGIPARGGRGRHERQCILGLPHKVERFQRSPELIASRCASS